MGKKASADVVFKKLFGVFGLVLLFYGSSACHRKSRQTVRNLETRLILVELKIRNNEDRLKAIEEMLRTLIERSAGTSGTESEQETEPLIPASGSGMTPPGSGEEETPGELDQTKPTPSTPPETAASDPAPDPPKKDANAEPSEISPESSRPAVETVPQEQAVEPRPVPRKPDPPANVGTRYKNAMDALNDRRWVEAETGFRAIETGFPRHRLAPNALYWLGESFYDRNDYQKAIEYFQAVLNRYPNSGKVPDALLKRGKSKERQGQLEEAFKDYRAVIEKYPSSRAARIAKSWL